jgi:hypothetical protein
MPKKHKEKSNRVSKILASPDGLPPLKGGDCYHRGKAAILEGSCFDGSLGSATSPQAYTVSPAARMFREATYSALAYEALPESPVFEALS